MKLVELIPILLTLLIVSKFVVLFTDKGHEVQIEGKYLPGSHSKGGRKDWTLGPASPSLFSYPLC